MRRSMLIDYASNATLKIVAKMCRKAKVCIANICFVYEFFPICEFATQTLYDKSAAHFFGAFIMTLCFFARNSATILNSSKLSRILQRKSKLKF